MIYRAPDESIVGYTIRKNWYKRLRAKGTSILKTEDAPAELENFKMRNCNVYWIETGSSSLESNLSYQIDKSEQSLLPAKEFESNTEKH
jgi:hypothetical protein